MKISYVGPKPLISHRGVSFDKNKDDKYVYMSIVLNLIDALNHDYLEDKVYSCSIDTQRLSNLELEHKLQKYCKNLNELVDKSNHNIEDEIAHNIQAAHESHSLTNVEKSVLEKNIKIMEDYMLQRSVNKAVYYCAINFLAKLVEKDHINYIKVPMTEKYIHVLHSLQGILETEKRPVDTAMEIYQKDGEIFAELKVITLG